MATRTVKNRKATAKKTATKVEMVEPEETAQQEEVKLTPSEQAAVDAESARYMEFQTQTQFQYLRGRIAELAKENQNLREVLETMRQRLQSYEDKDASA